MTFRFFLGIGLLAFLAGPAHSFEPSDAMKCFNFLPSDTALNASADLIVTFGDAGVVGRVDVRRYQPDTDAGRRLALAAARAVLACGPYTTSRGTAEFSLGPGTPNTSSTTITMPDRADGLDDSLGKALEEIIGK